MANYNDGKWHGWNGGKCPVHPKSIVKVQTVEGSSCAYAGVEADGVGWDTDRDHPACIIAFCVIEEYREPFECWVFTHASGHIEAYFDEAECWSEADKYDRKITVRKLREVLE